MITISLLPIVALLYFLYRCDKNQPEPLKMVLKGVFYGVLSVVVDLVLVSLIQASGFVLEDDGSWQYGLKSAFFEAAIPEELSKLFMLWLLLRKNKYFDEYVDGIVYACFVGLGFAALENILYVTADEDWLMVGIMRAIFSVPGHFFDAVAMGYFCSLYYFNVNGKRVQWFLLMILVPILFHGLYDALLMMESGVNETLASSLLLLFILGMIQLRKFAKKKILALKEKDLLADKETPTLT